MDSKKALLATLAVGVVANILDFVVHGQILTNAYYSKLPNLFRQDMAPTWFVIGDFVFAAVFVWVYDRVRGSFGGGPKGGMTYGLYMGVFLSFPTYIFFNLMFVGFPYALAWIWTIVGIVSMTILGTVAGAVYQPAAAAKAA